MTEDIGHRGDRASGGSGGVQRRKRGTRLEPPAYARELARVSELIRGVEVLTGKITASTIVLPLDMLESYERTLVAAHVANLLRLTDVINQIVPEPREEKQ